ncbi:haloacid dehalogenase superfamily protein, subfamily IA hydrolase, TIGR01548 [Synechococcus sp. PCC 7502]|uniref:TIGR01548 family HAD-type hydrolase n=1 Tax=Synechococcus sp. PCC 7502 TaxID=1173263 RepID=UPI00029F8BE4|nr:TIGR01548 family HAD-type hydrolase [Synechococcus sp. PCC 7502]AFY74657.1 haloacid dehalogenase superfamily protein, subfamily IA hydrolase, TIGR01548 [Synechococcus sp. PCC 7502]
MLSLSDVALILDIDGVIRDVFGSYHRALADTVEHFTGYRPTSEDIDLLKTEGIWNNDWEASYELIRRYATKTRKTIDVEYEAIVEFFQSRYRGHDPNNWTGYITTETLIATPEYFKQLTASGIKWGFFSGATYASASYVLNRLDISDPILVAMEDAPGKPDPTGLYQSAQKLDYPSLVIYAGDTAADMLTVKNARQNYPELKYIAVGILPPHVHHRDPEAYTQMLITNGADLVVHSILELNPETIVKLIQIFK